MILTDRLGPNILSAFWTKGQVLHRERVHLKVPGFSIVLNVRLTRKLPMFLSCLNEISGGCENNDGFYWVIARVKCEGEWNSVIFFLFVMFVVLTVDQFVERGDGPFELQKQDSHVFGKTGTFFEIC